MAAGHAAALAELTQAPTTPHRQAGAAAAESAQRNYASQRQQEELLAEAGRLEVDQ